MEKIPKNASAQNPQYSEGTEFPGIYQFGAHSHIVWKVGAKIRIRKSGENRFGAKIQIWSLFNTDLS